MTDWLTPHNFKSRVTCGCAFCGSMNYKPVPGYKKRDAKTIPIPAKDGNLKGLPLEGSFLDDGRFFRCWHCGFINAIDRNILGDAESRSGLTHIEELLQYHSATAIGSGTEALSPNGITPYQLLAVCGGISHSFVALPSN
jgi:hypothetical protein